MIKNRILALSVILLIYVAALFFGLFSYDYFLDELSFSWQLSLFLSDAAATIFVFIFSLLFNNASVYDPYWSVQPPIILTLAIIKCGAASIYGWMIFAAVLFWAIRLTCNWIYNFKSFEYQDWRYIMLKDKSGKLYFFVNLFGIHMFPTLVVYLCILPAVTVIKEGLHIDILQPAFLNVLFYIAVLLCFTSAFIQGLADIQMHIFRNSKCGGFIRSGLWKHGRHPNYACEIAMWWGIAFASIIVLGGQWWLLSGALLNTIMFLCISIPMADKRQSQKPGFEEYKKQTRILF